MILRFKDGTTIKNVKYMEVARQAVANMKPLQSIKNPEGYYTHYDFAQLCLDVILFMRKIPNELYVKDMLNYEKFVESMKHKFHLRKMENKTLRSYLIKGIGWVFLKVESGVSSPIDVESINLQKRDKIVSYIDGYNNVVDYDRQYLNQDEKLKLPRPNDIA